MADLVSGDLIVDGVIYRRVHKTLIIEGRAGNGAFRPRDDEGNAISAYLSADEAMAGHDETEYGLVEISVTTLQQFGFSVRFAPSPEFGETHVEIQGSFTKSNRRKIADRNNHRVLRLPRAPA